LLGTAAAFLVGRRLGPIVVAMALILGIALASASVAKLLGVVILLAVVGGSRALFDVAVRVLLQRTVAPGLLGRIFGLAEGLSMAGLAIGCVLAPLLVSLGGAQFALLSTAAVLPGVVLTRVGPLYRLDLHARVPVVEISLLRQLTIFRALPGAAIEGLAHALDKTSFEPGAVLVKEGDEGNCYYAIVEGTVEIRRRGQPIALLHRGQGLGEIALLRAVPRTATAVALTPVDAYRLGRDAFLTTVNGHVPTLKSTDQLVSDIQARDASRDAASPLSQPPNNSGSDSVPGEE
jgi:MFS family permease